jgi:hypothetical protein
MFLCIDWSPEWPVLLPDLQEYKDMVKEQRTYTTMMVAENKSLYKETCDMADMEFTLYAGMSDSTAMESPSIMTQICAFLVRSPSPAHCLAWKWNFYKWKFYDLSSQANVATEVSKTASKLAKSAAKQKKELAALKAEVREYRQNRGNDSKTRGGRFEPYKKDDYGEPRDCHKCGRKQVKHKLSACRTST